jgi:hypothetical protein
LKSADRGPKLGREQPPSEEDTVENTQRMQLHIDEDIGLERRQEIVALLEWEPGVSQAWFEHEDPHRLIVLCDPESFSAATLVDFVDRHGVHARVAA